jgi:hypothetical protein
MLGHLDIDQLDNVLSLADNMALKLAAKTSLELPLLNKLIKPKEREKMKEKFMKRKQLL